MAILTAKYLASQANQEALNTTPPALNNAMGIIGSEPANRIAMVSEYISQTYPNFSTTVSPTQIFTKFSDTQNPEIFYGSFPSNFTTSNITSLFNSISGTITSFTSAVDNTFNDRYSVTGFSMDAHTFFNYATWANVLAGGDTLIGGAGNDTLQDYGVSNTFYGLGGNDTLIAAAGGVNTAVMRGKASDYYIASSNNIRHDGLSGISGFTANDNVSNRDGYTQLVNVNRLHFTDTNIALDVGPTENAGSVYMLYKAAFNRAPDAGGMGYWLAQKDKGADIVTNLAQGFVNSAEFTAKYGANPTNAAYVDKLYQNVLGRAGEAGGVTYWNQELDAGRISKAAVLVQFATLPEGASNVASLIANGIPYQEWMG